MRSARAIVLFCAISVACCSAASAGDRKAKRALPVAGQMLVTVTDGWNSSSGELYAFERTRSGWKLSFDKPIPVLLGRNGLAWGRGLRGQSEKGTHKREGDGRAPAGVFEIGKIYTYDAKLPKGASYPFRTVTKYDAWIDDPNHEQYNQHVVVNPKAVPPWFEKQKMRHGDFAYRWLIEIRHNSDPPQRAAGSAIFFHTRRGPTRKTAGCTTMDSNDLVRVMRWLDVKKKPQYTLLPKAEYVKRAAAWNLPKLP